MCAGSLTAGTSSSSPSLPDQEFETDRFKERCVRLGHDSGVLKITEDRHVQNCPALTRARWVQVIQRGAERRGQTPFESTSSVAISSVRFKRTFAPPESTRARLGFCWRPSAD